MGRNPDGPLTVPLPVAVEAADEIAARHTLKDDDSQLKRTHDPASPDIRGYPSFVVTPEQVTGPLLEAWWGAERQSLIAQGRGVMNERRHQL